MSREVFLKIKNYAFVVIYFFSIACVYYLFLQKSDTMIQADIINPSNSSLMLLILMFTTYLFGMIYILVYLLWLMTKIENVCIIINWVKKSHQPLRLRICKQKLLLRQIEIDKLIIMNCACVMRC